MHQETHTESKSGFSALCEAQKMPDFADIGLNPFVDPEIPDGLSNPFVAHTIAENAAHDLHNLKLVGRRQLSNCDTAV